MNVGKATLTIEDKTDVLAARVAAIGQAIDTLPSEPFATPILFWDAAAGDNGSQPCLFPHRCLSC